MNGTAHYCLQNKRLLIELDDNGALRSFVDKQTGRNYIVPLPSYGRPLFELIMTEVDDRGDILPGDIELNALLAERVAFHECENGLEIRYYRIDGLPLHVICHISLDEDAPLSRWRIEVQNDTSFALKEILYPVIRTVYQLGDSMHDDRILIPKHDGHLVTNPDVLPWEGDGYPLDHQRYMYPGEGRNFPVGASVQMTAYYDADGGMYIGIHDEGAMPKRIGPAQLTLEDVKQFEFSPAHIISEIPGLSVNLEYDTVLGCFDGDWQAAADIYKAWATNAHWCKKTIAERDDIPDWLKKGAFFFNFRLRHQASGEAFLDEVPDYVERWKQLLDMPMVAMMCGWEQIGEWTGPEYFPPFGGEERFARMCDELKERGIKPFPFGLSGLKLAIRKKIPRSGLQPELAVDYDARDKFEQEYKPHAATKQGGEIILDSKVNEWDGLHAYACPTTEQARSQLYGVSMELIEKYGVQVSQADQLFNGASTECYNTEHGHPAGRGPWQTDALRQIYRDLRRDGKEQDPDFVLSQEWQSELFLQELDVYHCRNYDQPRGLMGVPLFSYLYHEYQISYGGDWSSFRSDNTNGVYYHAANFVNGNLPAGSPQTMLKDSRNIEPEEADFDIMRMAINTCRLFPHYTDFLVLGKMIRTLPLQVAGIDIRFVGVNFGFAKGTRTVPSVLHQGWQAPDGRIAYALANVTDQEQSFYLPLEHESLTGPVRLTLNVNHTKRIVVAERTSLPETVKITLEKGDAAMLEIETITG